MTQYLTITPEELFADTRALAKKIAAAGKSVKGILAIARGGLIPAGILAYSLDIRTVHSLNVESYDGEERRASVEIKNAPELADGGAGYMIVDDLADTGRTMDAVRALYPKAFTACPYTKPEGKNRADFTVREVPQTTWIVFPWDAED